MRIIINADDYGWDESCSKAIIKAFENGWLSTTTACANGIFFKEAAEIISKTEYCNNVGLHFNLTEGKPVSNKVLGERRICRNGEFFGFPSRQIPLSLKTQRAVLCELRTQSEVYLNTGLKIHHIDSHHFIHNSVSVFPLIKHLAKQLNVNKIRQFRNVGAMSQLKVYIKKYYNSVLHKNGLLYSDYFGSANDYMNFSGGKSNEVFEIMVHPDYTLDGILIDRENEDYSNPTGEPLEKLIEVVYERGDSII